MDRLENINKQNQLLVKNDKRPLSILICCKKGEHITAQIALKLILMMSVYEDIQIYIEDKSLSLVNHIAESQLKSQQQNLPLLQSMLNKLIKFNQNLHENNIQLIITIGGDGTILYTVNQFQNRPSPPIISIQKGTLGFLCQYSQKECEQELGRILEKIRQNQHIKVQNKMRITGMINTYENKEKTYTKSFHSLNEVVISRGSRGQAIKLDIYINDQYFTQFVGDGLLLSTPTGTTAYSASAGGSIVSSDVRSISLIPICPLSLSFRPIILSDKAQIKIKIGKESRGIGLISGDGSQQHMELDRNSELIVQASKYDVPIIADKSTNSSQDDYFHNWLHKLKNLLKWNSNFI